MLFYTESWMVIGQTVLVTGSLSLSVRTWIVKDAHSKRFGLSMEGVSIVR